DRRLAGPAAQRHQRAAAGLRVRAVLTGSFVVVATTTTLLCRRCHNDDNQAAQARDRERPSASWCERWSRNGSPSRGGDRMPVYALDDQLPAIDPEAYVHPDAVIIGNVELGPGSSVWPGAVLRGDHGLIRVGERSSIQDGTIIHTTREWAT